MSDHVKVYAVLTAKDGCADDLADLLRGMVTPSRAETGNLRYDLWQEKDSSNRFVLDEIYVDQNAASSHRNSAHFQNYASRINNLAERLAVVVVPVDVAKGGQNVQ